MSKTLIIAEKPSVALDISRALGGFTRKEDHFENEQYVLAASVGHLLSLVAPNDPIKGKWSFTHLPVIPTEFELGPTDKRASERLKLLTRLAKRRDVTAIVNACDAGREGELIFRYIIQYAGVKKPIQRLWLQSMTQTAIREAFGHLREDAAMKPLEAAARSRAEADWLVGINGTRAMTAFNSKDGGFFKTTVGRVQTPTLAIVHERENRIHAFVPRDYWEVQATFAAEAGVYVGRWIDPAFKKDELDPEKRESRLWSLATAQAIAAACEGQPGTVSDTSKPTSQLSPALYDLTSLQREANSRFGFSAKTTLSLAQTLYERHKALTYPRTDSRYLPEDYLPTISTTLQALGEVKVGPASPLAPYARQILTQNWVKPNRRIFDNKKVSDHFAIIPTQQSPAALNEAENKLYELVLKRFLAVFFPAAEYRVTTRLTYVQNPGFTAAHSGQNSGFSGDDKAQITHVSVDGKAQTARVSANDSAQTAHASVEGDGDFSYQDKVQQFCFRTDGKVLVAPGWLAVYGKEAQQEDANLVAISNGESVHTQDVEVANASTKPPPHYNEGTLLSAMESAGKRVEDEALREAMSARGLGTPATRAAIIEGLLNESYLRREGRDLMPTAKARQLMTLLAGLDVAELTSPELTGEWEHKLKQIEQGSLARDAFMHEIADMTQNIVKRAKNYERDTIPGDYATLQTPCPKCGSLVKENYRRFACTQCDFSISKYPGGRTFELQEVEEFLTHRQIGPLQGFISKMGRPFAAILRLADDDKLEFDFGQNNESDAEVDFTGHVSLGNCPKCQARVFEHGMNYVCEKAVGPNKTCDFRTGKVILQQEISREQIAQLLSQGRTAFLEGFISSRTHRKFKAALVRDATGKIGFEFAPRAEKVARATGKSEGGKATAKKTVAKTSTKLAAKTASVKKSLSKK